MKVVTCSPDPWNGPYARFLETYVGPPLTIYTEAVHTPTWHENADIRPLAEVVGLADFLDFVNRVPACHDHWQFDVRRFCRKSFVWFHEARRSDGKLFWFDSDVEFSAPLDPNFLSQLLGDADMCYLGRQNYHPCSSFVGWNLDQNAGLFMNALQNLYESTLFLRCGEWHDAYLVGEILKTAPADFVTKNLTPEGKPVENVFDTVFSDARHFKGPGKFH